MEDKIIERAKFLMFRFGKDINQSIIQAIEEIAEPQELNDIYKCYDCTLYDYATHIKRKIQGEI